MILVNALLVDLDPPRVTTGSLRIEAGKITARGDVTAAAGEEIVDCGGAVVLPCFVNGHTHLYSALAVGMPMPREEMRNFHDILKYLWWRLDRALDGESVELSARVGAMEALRCGTTTLIDHHASPNVIDGSLDLIEEGLRKIGVRGVLCYETTDRNGREGRVAGLKENRRYLKKCEKRDGRFAALVGAHASFTCDDETMEALGELAREIKAGVHIHVAEDPVDEALTREQYGAALMERLMKYGLLIEGSIFAHGTHLDRAAYNLMRDTRVCLAHNTRSNMNNAVGYTRLGKVSGTVLLGTDGIGANMFAEAQTAWFKSRDEKTGIAPDQVVGMLVNNARFASKLLGVTVGKLEVGAEADVVVTNYVPSTPLHDGNIAGHLIFGMGAQHVRSVLAGGEWKLRDGKFMEIDEKETRATARNAARTIHKTFY